MSSSDYSTSPNDKRSPNYIHLPSTSSEDTVQTPFTADDHSRTFWTYFKWFVWTAISGLFDCGSAVSELSLVRYWPAVSNDRVAFRPPKKVNGKQSECEKFDAELEEVFFRSTQSTPTHSLKTADENFLLLETVQHIISKIPEETIQQDITPSIVYELKETVNPSPAHSQFTKLGVWPPVVKDVTAVTKDKSPSPKPCTLLASVYAESKNGLIDDAARDLIVKDLLSSVIPRNLSNSSDITVTPAIRKMYAWTNPNSLHSCDEDGTTDQRKRPDSFDLVSNSSASDNPLAYPGKLTMSDSSFSPQSPGTGESSTPAGEDPPRTDEYGDLFLPDIDKQDHTLAWAISNLKMCDDKNASSVIGKHLPETPPSPRILADRPPLPLGGSTRQSRDKSPVCTINSARLVDTMSLPAIMPFEGEQLFVSSSSHSHEHRSNEIPKPKRSSSLKSHRTPPGTPSTPKAVRFADAFGLDLATVRHVFDQEAPPKIPASATFDLHLDTDESIAKIGAKQFGLCFAQPGTASNFIRRVLSQTVCLEDAYVDMPRGVLTGTIRVKSLGFEKHIYVRITYNNWATFFDVQASYVQGSHDGATDRFSFSVVFPDTMVPGDRAQFAIRYDAHTGQQFWDNNHGQNYSVTCYAKATDLAGDGSWVHYL
ncbi:unnamed protein product [Calicophoron daubneyi]|uniref:CBM21 domain-containing protein n=1 Tax=Calicophoron daubneyi TaxID=300641 RepID=A0AAV2T461_CALDB